MSVDHGHRIRTLWVALPVACARQVARASPKRTCGGGFNEEAVQFRWSLKLVSRFRELCVHPAFVPDYSRLRVGRIEMKSGLYLARPEQSAQLHDF